MSVVPSQSIGVFTSLGRANRSGLITTVVSAEDLGFDALWLADVRGDLSFLAKCTEATNRIAVASAVLSVWDLEPISAATAFDQAEAVEPGRAVLGLGVSHQSIPSGRRDALPLGALARYLDALDTTKPLPVPPSSRIIGANGPNMLAVAGERTAGAITQLVTPDRTALQRSWLGRDALLAAEVKVVLGGSTEQVRELGRRNLRNYLGLPTYQRNLRAQGFSGEDLTGGGSDRLVDALVAGPDVDHIQARIAEHRLAGADHICLHVLAETDGVPLENWRKLAETFVPCTSRSSEQAAR